MSNYVFSTGTARGGTGLLAHMLSVHQRVKIVSDPFLALYKSFRNSVVMNVADPALKSFDLSSPIGDGYFTQDRRKILDLILNSDMNVKFEQSEWPNLKMFLKKRAALASADIVPHIDSLAGDTYKEIYQNCFSLLSKIRSPEKKLDWIGIHENWTVDFFIPLAKAFENSKFIIVIRDPRAVFSSHLREKDPLVIGHLVSYARCHRKLIACAEYYKTLPLFKDRLSVIRYEDMLINPEENCKALCDFLNVAYNQDMLDTSKYINHSTGGVHDGLSNYEENAQGFIPERIDRWRKYLSLERSDLIDFLCGPEMLLYKYDPIRIKPFDSSLTLCLETILNEMSGYKAWRCDFMDPMKDYGFELVRRSMLASPSVAIDFNKDLIERNFLFKEVYAAIKSLKI